MHSKTEEALKNGARRVLHHYFLTAPIVYRLGRQVFILESRVRLPVGVQMDMRCPPVFRQRLKQLMGY